MEDPGGYIIRLYAITIYYIFKECFKSMGRQDNQLTTEAWARELFEKVAKAIEGQPGAKNWTASPINRAKYLRVAYDKAFEQILAGEIHAVVPLNYRTFLPLLDYAGIGDNYTRLNVLFAPGHQPGKYEVKSSKGHMQEIVFTIDRNEYCPPANLQEAVMTDSPVSSKADSLLRYRIPIRPVYFVGRTILLRNIHDHLVAGKHQIILLQGIGGMGKTTLMQVYLHEKTCLEYFNRIIYVSVNKNLETAFVNTIGLALGLDDRRKMITGAPEQLTFIAGEMSKFTGTNLIVIDNVNERDFKDLQVLRNIFQQTGWKFLITSRPNPDGFFALNVNELDIADAGALFMHHYLADDILAQDITNEHAVAPGAVFEGAFGDSLSKLLNHIIRHTLLIELLAKSANKKQLTLTALLDRLVEQDFRHPDLQRVVYVGDHAKEQLSTAKLHQYLLSLFDTEYLTNTAYAGSDPENELKVTMLRFFSVLPPLDMPMPDLKRLWKVQTADENDFEDRLDELRQIGWLQGKRGFIDTSLTLQEVTYKMHRLVQEIVYEKLRPNMQNCAPLVISLRETLEDNSAIEPRPYQQYAKEMIRKLLVLGKGLEDFPG